MGIIPLGFIKNRGIIPLGFIKNIGIIPLGFIDLLPKSFVFQQKIRTFAVGIIHKAKDTYVHRKSDRQATERLEGQQKP